MHRPCPTQVGHVYLLFCKICTHNPCQDQADSGGSLALGSVARCPVRRLYGVIGMYVGSRLYSPLLKGVLYPPDAINNRDGRYCALTKIQWGSHHSAGPTIVWGSHYSAFTRSWQSTALPPPNARAYCTVQYSRR